MKLQLFTAKTLLLSVMFLSACNNSDYTPSAEEKESVPPPMDEAGSAENSKTYVTNNGLTTTLSGTTAANFTMSDKKAVETDGSIKIKEKIPEKIKKTADINLSVDDYKDARSSIEKIVKSGDAYISGENEQNNTYSISNKMMIRVRNKDFDRMVNSISGIKGHVNSKNIYTEDVTAQFIDITARIKSKKEVEERYLELLKKAGKVTDILEVEEQLRVIREEIEAKEGQLKYLNDQVDYSTINLSFHQDFEYTPQDRPGFFGRMGAAFGNGWNGFLSFLVGVMYAWPLWVVLSIGGYFLYRYIKKQVKK
jgi:hypothetical protein